MTKLFLIKTVTVMALLPLLLGIVHVNDRPGHVDDRDLADPSNGLHSEMKTRNGMEIDFIPDLQYIAIGPDRFREELAPLIDWKTQKGVRAEFYPLDTESGILTNYQDRDTQAEIRSFIRDVKEVNPSIKWVLLAGDGEIIPSRRTFTNESFENGGDDDSNYVNSDFYYAGLTGSWDQNGNEVYGEYMEQDWEADVYVGRLPASSEGEISTMVRKQLSYEKDPPLGSWADSMLLSGSLMDTPNNPVAFQSYKDNAYELVLNIERELPDHVTPFHLVDYPKLEYGGYNQMFDTLNRSSFESFYEMGHSTVLVACHGDPHNGNCTNYKGEGGGRWEYIRDYEDHFTYDMAESIDNGERLPLVYISSCASTTFMEEDDTNMERLLRNEDGGAISLIGATVDTYRGEFRPDPNEPDKNSSYGNWWLAQEFFRILYGGTTRPGEALYKQKWNYIGHVENEYSYDPLYFRMFYVDNLAYNLLGDPEGPIWIQRPREMTVEHPSTMVYDDEGVGFTVLDEDGRTPLRDAKVTITCVNHDETYITGRTDILGRIVLDLSREDLEDITMTVTKDGYIPVVDMIEVYSDMNIAVDDVSLEPKIPVGKEELSVKVTISNNGERDIEAIQIHLTLTGENEIRKSTPVLNLMNGTTVNKTIYLTGSIPRYGENQIIAGVEIVSFQGRKVIESDPEDNERRISFTANHPIEVSDYLPKLRIDEDSSLALDHGLMNLTEPYIYDFDDYPRKVRIWTEIISGDIDVTLHGTLMDVIPAQDWNGPGEIRIFASDGSVTRNGTIEVEVVPKPDAPQFIEYPGSIETSEDGTDTFRIIIEDIDSTDIDLRSDKEWVSIERDHNVSGLVFNVTTRPKDEDVGESILHLLAVDETNLSEEVRINVHVASTNDPPDIQLISNLSFEQGSENEVLLTIEDPDGDTEFLINASWEYGNIRTSYPNFTIKVPGDAEPGKYVIAIKVDDRGGGVTTIKEEITILEKKNDTSFILLIVMILVIVTALVTYGIFLRLQESRQKRMLDSVGTNAPLEAKALSEKDFKTRRRGRRKKDDGIPMPPAPRDVEGALIKEEKKGEPDGGKEDQRVEQRDLDSEIDDVISELFPQEPGK